jgi:hypothetical protein
MNASADLGAADRNLALELVRVTEAAARAGAPRAGPRAPGGAAPAGGGAPPAGPRLTRWRR